MNTEEIKNLIELYFDGELEKDKEVPLFTLLSQDLEARNYFKSLNLIHNSIEISKEEFPRELEERIFYSLKNNQSFRKEFFKTSAARIISYSIVIILLIINIFLLGKISAYNEKVNNVEKVVQQQYDVIKYLYNSIPAVEVEAKRDNEIIIKSNL